jgi:hypothetical protein
MGAGVVPMRFPCSWLAELPRRAEKRGYWTPVTIFLFWVGLGQSGQLGVIEHLQSDGIEVAPDAFGDGRVPEALLEKRVAVGATLVLPNRSSPGLPAAAASSRAWVRSRKDSVNQVG